RDHEVGPRRAADGRVEQAADEVGSDGGDQDARLDAVTLRRASTGGDDAAERDQAGAQAWHPELGADLQPGVVRVLPERGHRTGIDAPEVAEPDAGQRMVA